MFPLFATPIGVYKDINYPNIKNQFIEMCYEEKKIDPSGNVISNRLGWQSKGDWFYKEKNKIFYEYIHKMVENLFYESYDHPGELSFGIRGCWININPSGGYNVSHTHPQCDYAGVFYVNIPESCSSPIVFDNPSSHSDSPTFRMYSDNFKDTYGIYSEVNLMPSEGTMVVFPSSIRHFVDENDSDDNRISIAFNISIDNYGRFAENSKRGFRKW